MDSCWIYFFSPFPATLIRPQEKIQLLFHLFSLYVLLCGALPGHPADIVSYLHSFFAFSFSEQNNSGDDFNLYFKTAATYELQNMLVGTYPVAEHYRDCGQDLDSDS